MVGGFDHETSNILPEITIKAKLQKDDHANPSLVVLDSGHVVIFYSAHNGNTMFFKISKHPEDISVWGKGKHKLLLQFVNCACSHLNQILAKPYHPSMHNHIYLCSHMLDLDKTCIE